jgi:hypothetical protein
VLGGCKVLNSEHWFHLIITVDYWRDPTSVTYHLQLTAEVDLGYEAPARTLAIGAVLVPRLTTIRFSQWKTTSLLDLRD